MTGPMDGVKILDLSVALTGPLATGMLCDQGASVVKVERPPFGDQVRFVGTRAGGMTAMFQVANRGKQSIGVDLTDPRGVELVLGLAKEADVLIHNYRPGAVDRMGIGYDTVKALNPDIVYASLCGFGETGPYSGRRVYDTIVQAQAGLSANQTGLNDEHPVFLRQLMADKVTAYTACQAITAALFARAQGRGGQHLHLNMLDANVAFLFVDGAGHEVALDGDHTGPTSASASTTAIALKDGHMTIAPVTDAEFHGLCGAFGVDSSDPGLATMGDRMTNRELMSATIRHVHANAAGFTVAEATAAMDAHDSPCGIVLGVAEVPDCPQVQANELFMEHEHPTMGRIRETRHPTVFDGTPVDCSHRDCPTLGQHTDQVLADLGFTDKTAQLRSDGVVF